MALWHPNITRKYLDGFWGPVTSTLDWCEANYQFSRYIAEMANSVSNAYSFVLALYGAHNVRSQGLPTRYFIGFLTFAIVGLGSFAFHATLLYSAQLADELPMIYSVSSSLFISFDAVTPGHALSAYSKVLLASVIAFDIFFTISYWIYRNPIYHQFVFGCMMLLITGRNLWLTRFSKVHSVKLDEAKKKEATSLLQNGVLWFIFGFVIWNLDNVFCGAITQWKRQLGWPGAFLLEGHAWWHFLTGYGSYLIWMGTTYLTVCIKDDPHKYTIVYDLGHLPRIKTVQKVKQ